MQCCIWVPLPTSHLLLRPSHLVFSISSLDLQPVMIQKSGIWSLFTGVCALTHLLVHLSDSENAPFTIVPLIWWWRSLLIKRHQTTYSFSWFEEVCEHCSMVIKFLQCHNEKLWHFSPHKPSRMITYWWLKTFWSHAINFIIVFITVLSIVRLVSLQH